jgi:uncharacterized membrane protein YbhN (UPF0104 family)
MRQIFVEGGVSESRIFDTIACMIRNKTCHVLQNLLKVLAGIFLLVISLWGVEWTQLNQSVDTISFLILLEVVCLMLGSLFLKVTRSFMLLKQFGVRISLGQTTEAFFLGQATNFLLPSRGGDILRVGYLSVGQPSLLPQVTAAIMLEKLLDLIALTIVALGVSTYLPTDRAFWVRSWLLPLSALATIGLFTLIFLGPMILVKLRNGISQVQHVWVKKILILLDQLVNSSLWLRNPRRLILSLLMTSLIWALMWWTNMILFDGFLLQVPLIAGGLVLILGYLGVLPNLMPGNVGPFYFFVQLAMDPFEIPQETGLAYTVLLHAIITVTPLVASGISLLASESVRKSFITLWKSR